MKKREFGLAKIHAILGVYNDDILKGLIKKNEIFNIMNRKEAKEYADSVPFSVKERKNAENRINSIDFLKIEDILQKKDVKVIDYYCPEYPSSLRNIFEPPSILYLKGELQQSFKIAVVGPRNPSIYAKEVTRKIVNQLTENNITIVSGMAMGIDAIAHIASCRSSAGTIGVLGNGIDIIYPSMNKEIYHKLEDNLQNCLISEFPVGYGPTKYTFPRRNRIISGLANGVVVSEAGIKSGSLITARHAYEQGKNIYAIPGLITNPLTKGVHQLIRDGAILVECAADILEDLYPMLKIEANNKKILNLNDVEASIVGNLEINPQSLEEILSVSKTGISETMKTLSLLEIKGIIKKEKNNKYFVII